MAASLKMGKATAMCFHSCRLVWLGLCLSLIAKPLPAQSPEVIEKAEKAVVRIEVTTAEGKGQGSGFVVESSGVVLTNCHVIENATEATAVFPSGKTAKIIGIRLIDPKRDIAVLRIDGSGFDTLTLADKTPRKGESVTALGSPLGLSFTVTRGIVSAVRGGEEMQRDAGIEEAEGTWLQVDAALSPGNSGGPMISETGEVVAMSTLASKQGAQNVNFGISAADIRQAIDVSASRNWQTLSVGSATGRKSTPAKPAEVDREKILKLIPDQAIRDMATQVEANLPKYKKDILLQQSQMRLFLRELNSAQIDASYSGNSMRTTHKLVNGKRKETIVFSNIDAKHKKIDQVTKLLGEIDLVLANGKISTLEAWKTLLCLAGPSIELRRDNGVGIVRNARYTKRFEDDYAGYLDGTLAVIITDQDNPPSTLDSKFAAFVGFVVERETLSTSKGPVDLVVIAQIPDVKLGRILLGSGGQVSSGQSTSKSTVPPPKASSASGDGLASVEAELFGNGPASSLDEGYREWNDRTGKFSVAAKLISSTASQVTLKKKDGRVLTIDLNVLSDADQRYVRQSR